MAKRPDMHEKNANELFLSQAVMDLKQGLTTYVYKNYILDELKNIFSDLDITRNDFYWTVRNNEVSK